MRTALAFPLSVSTTGLLVRWTWLRISLVFRLRSVTERMSSERLSGIQSSCFDGTKYSAQFSDQQRCEVQQGLTFQTQDLSTVLSRGSFGGPPRGSRDGSCAA